LQWKRERKKANCSGREKEKKAKEAVEERKKGKGGGEVRSDRE